MWSRHKNPDYWLSYGEKLMILDYMKANDLPQSQTANHFAAQGYGTWVSQKTTPSGRSMKTRSKGRWGRLEELQPRGLGRFAILKLKLCWSCGLWGKRQEVRLEPITGQLIKIKAERLCTVIGITDDAIRFSNGWLEEFKNWHGDLARLAQSISPMLMMNESEYRRCLMDWILRVSSMLMKSAFLEICAKPWLFNKRAHWQEVGQSMHVSASDDEHSWHQEDLPALHCYLDLMTPLLVLWVEDLWQLADDRLDSNQSHNPISHCDRPSFGLGQQSCTLMHLL